MKICPSCRIPVKPTFKGTPCLITRAIVSESNPEQTLLKNQKFNYIYEWQAGGLENEVEELKTKIELLKKQKKEEADR